MKVVDLLKQARALRPRDREKLLMALLEMKEELPTSQRKAGRVKWPDIDVRAKRIFGSRVVPNLVLLEREETPF